MNSSKWSLAIVAVLLLVVYNSSQPGLEEMRTRTQALAQAERINYPNDISKKAALRHIERSRYGPSMVWLDRLINANEDRKYRVPLNFNVLSSMMIAGMASGFKSQVANLLWMKSDEYWHEGLFTRQNPIMEAVVTLDPQFIDAWSTAGWHWAYNIYADSEEKWDKRKDLSPAVREQKLREEQDQDIDTGLDYLKRGSEENPDTYRLWFEWGWTRAEKAGLYDDQTVDLYRKARAQGDARLVDHDVQVNGAVMHKKVEGLDIIGRTIGHLYERIPDIDKALNQYGNDFLKLNKNPRERAALDTVAVAWRHYGMDGYEAIVRTYNSGDATVKAHIKALVPNIEAIAAADPVRFQLSADQNLNQPVGAYISITARYVPTWQLMKQGKLQQAVDTIIGVMNVDTRYHLQGLSVLGKVLEVRGDAPQAVKKMLDQQKQNEKDATQNIGLHLLARLYEMQAAQEKDPTKQVQLYHKAYDTWYRSRARDALDFYARTNTVRYEDKYHFSPPEDIIKAIDASRKNGDVNAAPPPNIEMYHQSPSA